MHAFCGQALHKLGRDSEATPEFIAFIEFLNQCLQKSNLHSSDALAYACGYAALFYERNKNLDLAQNLFERASDHWETAGLPGKYNLAVTHMNRAFIKIKTNQYQEACNLLKNGISDINESGELNIGFQNKLRFYFLNTRLKSRIPIIPMLSEPQ